MGQLHTKQCSKCKETKDLTEFGKRKRSKDGLQAWCKICTAEYGRTPDQRAKAKARYDADPLTNNVKSKAYYSKHKDKCKAQQKEYRQRKAAEMRERNVMKRAQRKQAIPDFVRDCPQEKKRLIQIYKLRAVMSDVTGIRYEVDHMWPLDDGGPHWSGNLQIITQEENRSKSATVIPEIKQSVQDMLNQLN